jgi:flagellar capping protein FliD
MTITTTIFNSMSQNINDSAVNELTAFGVSQDEAVKFVLESDFDLILSANENPVIQF